jgi:hypothetical protein
LAAKQREEWPEEIAEIFGQFQVMMRTKLEGIGTAISASQGKMGSIPKAVGSYQQKMRIPIHKLHENIENSQEKINAIVNAIQEKKNEEERRIKD